MKHKNGEIYFKGRGEALAYWLTHRDMLKEVGFVVYKCARCGVNFASQNPSTDMGGILCYDCEVDERRGRRR